MTREPLFIATGDDAPIPELPFAEREAITAIVRDPKKRAYLILRWKQVDWHTFVTGGVEKGQTPEEAARAEVREETGFKNLALVYELPRTQSKFFHKPKNLNRHAFVSSFLFELVDDARDAVSQEEQAKHDVLWLTEEKLKTCPLPEVHQYLLGHILTNRR